MSIYKPCDIRGSAGSELTPDLYRRWGMTLGQQVEPGAKFVIGGDVRESTPSFLSALADGLCRAGLDVVTVGALPTPMIYYAKRRLGAAGCAIVTASHNPKEWNGIKLVRRGALALSGDAGIKEIREWVTAGRYADRPPATGERVCATRAASNPSCGAATGPSIASASNSCAG